MTVVALPRSRPALPLDARFMGLAISVSRRMMGRTWPNPSVGAVLVRQDAGSPVVVGRGWTAPGGRPHAETEALRRAGEAARGATLYVTLEPCSHHGHTPPCADAIVNAGIARVVAAVGDPNPIVSGGGYDRLRAAGIAVETGVGAVEAGRILAGHLRRMRDGRPHVMVKLAVSADGKIGLPNRRPVAITGPEIQARVHLLRASSDAVVIGVGTALADDPLLTCRLPGMAARSPVRVILDTELRLPLTSKLVASIETAPLWVVCGMQADENKENLLRERGVQVFRSATADGILELRAALELLASKGLTRLMIEGGSILASRLVQTDLVDEFAISRAPKIIGADGVDALEGMALSAVTASPRFVSRGVEAMGVDTIEVFDRAA